MNNTIHGAACRVWEDLRRLGGRNDTMQLVVLIGYANRPRGVDLTGHLVWGVTWWGTRHQANRISSAYRAIRLGGALDGFEIADADTKQFGGGHATVFRNISGENA